MEGGLYVWGGGRLTTPAGYCVSLQGHRDWEFNLGEMDRYFIIEKSIYGINVWSIDVGGWGIQLICDETIIKQSNAK